MLSGTRYSFLLKNWSVKGQDNHLSPANNEHLLPPPVIVTCPLLHLAASISWTAAVRTSFFYHGVSLGRSKNRSSPHWGPDLLKVCTGKCPCFSPKWTKYHATLQPWVESPCHSSAFVNYMVISLFWKRVFKVMQIEVAPKSLPSYKCFQITVAYEMVQLEWLQLLQ